MSVIGNALASATVEETFEKDILIYDLGELLSVLAIAPDPDVILNDKFLTVKWGSSKVKYSYSDREIMRDSIAASTKQVKFPDPDVEFVLTVEMLASIHKAASILKAGFISIFSEDGKVLVKVFDKGLVNGNTFILETDVETDLEFSAVVEVSNLKFLIDNYNVSVSSKNICRFSSCSNDLIYYVTLDVSSRFQ
jgi:hypothetical protein